MPKIFGNVTTSANGRLFCKNCGYSWVATSANEVDLQANHRITCPVCRLLKDKNIRGFVDNENQYRFISTPILNMKYRYLMSSGYLDIGIPVMHLKCNHKFTVKARDLLDKIECPYCNRNSAIERYKDNIESKDKTLNNKTDTETIKEISSDEKIYKQLDKKESEYEGNTKKIDKSIGIKQPQTKHKMTVEERMEKARNSRSNKRKTQIEEIINSMRGKVYGKQVLINGMDSNGQCICQCIHCGFESHIPISQMLNKDKRAKALTCDVCKENFSNDPNYIDRLINRYIGKVYNGLIIQDIYSDDEDVTRCDVECINSRTFGIEIKPGHLHKNVLFGDLINNKYVCPTCAHSSNTDIISNILSGSISCRRFDPINRYNSGKYGYNKDKEDLSVEKLYTTNGYLCDYCNRAGTCDRKHRDDSSFEVIRDISDRMKNINASASEVSAEYPSIYNNQNKDANICKTMQETGLQVFRDAYVGRDGRLYKFCKCSVHRTEMILSESEISEFDHSQCTDKCNSNLRFFNIDAKYLLSNS